MREHISVYRNQRTGWYFVQPYTIGPVADTAFGEPIAISPQEFDTKIAAAVLSSLERFGKDTFDDAHATRHTPKQQRGFVAQHLEVHIQRDERGALIVHPLHHERGGYVGRDDDVIVLLRSELPYGIAAAVTEAFRRAT